MSLERTELRLGYIPLSDAAPLIAAKTKGFFEMEGLDVTLAREAGRAGGTVPAVYNASNEVCVAAFLAGRIPFTGIVDTVAQVVSEHDGGSATVTEVAEILAADHWARTRAGELTGTA